MIKKLNKLAGAILCGLLLASCSTGHSFLTDAQLGGDDTDKGVAYLLGRRVPQNNQQAFSHFKKAADRGNASAQNEVAYLYAAGKGTPKNKEKALLYYQKAADQGIASAQYNLGLMYLHGVGTEKNQVEARKWFEKSAANGFEPAKASLKQNRLTH